MDSVQIITNEWIDIIYLDNKTKKAIRKNLNFGGSYYFENNQSILHIVWNIWGKETFYKKKDIYYNILSNIFEIELQNNKGAKETNNKNNTKDTKVYIFNTEDNSVYLKNEENQKGIYKFNDNILTIIWDNENEENYEQIDIKKSKKYKKIETPNPKKDIKILAIVFPQFHEIPENNEFWGHGFTEWTLLKNIPRIVSGEIIKQPHEDIGYFNLNDINHRTYMTTLANRFNIYGFCYYHYWFKNKKVMYEPLEKMLIDGQPNKPFLFCWANEQWTRRWDGGNEEVLLEQSYSDNEGNINHFLYLLPFFKHDNYIKITNKPIFIFYRIEEKDIEQINTIIELWNKMALKNGFNGIHFIRFLGPFNNNIVINDIKGYVEFAPGYCTQKNYNDICIEDENKIFEQYDGHYNEETYLTKNSDIKTLVEKKIFNSGLEHYNSISEKERKIRTSQFFTYDGLKLYEKILELPRIYKEQHRGLSLQWNNTPRRNYTNKEYNKYPHYYKNINPQLFGNTLKKLMEKINSDSNEVGHDFLFLSAWNEWNEQAILEPNNEDGYDYLHNLKKNYLEFYSNEKSMYNTKNILVFGHKGGGTEKYMDDIKNKFLEYKFIDFDIYKEELNYDIYYNNYNIDRIHINSILYNNLKTNYITLFSKYFKNIEKYLTIHDYQWYYPDNPNILKDDFNDSTPTITNINNFYKLIKLCTKIIFPSQSIYKNYSKYINLSYYNDKICVVNHMDKIINHNFLVCPPILNNMNKIKIAFLGNFLKYKGTDILDYISNHFQIYESHKTIYNIEYHVYGLVIDNNILKKNKYKYIFHDIYKDNEIIDLIHQEGIHGILHLSIFEETYCYSLTNSINSGLPIFYLNYGAFSERLCNNNFKNKYFASEKNNIFENYTKFLDFIVNHQGEKQEFYKLNQNIQYNKWYLENY
jgi:hypothetical protein